MSSEGPEPAVSALSLSNDTNIFHDGPLDCLARILQSAPQSSVLLINKRCAKVMLELLSLNEQAEWLKERAGSLIGGMRLAAHSGGPLYGWFLSAHSQDVQSARTKSCLMDKELAWASKNGCTHAIRPLIEAGASRLGIVTALRLAAGANHADTVRALARYSPQEMWFEGQGQFTYVSSFTNSTIRDALCLSIVHDSADTCKAVLGLAVFQEREGDGKLKGGPHAEDILEEAVSNYAMEMDRLSAFSEDMLLLPGKEEDDNRLRAQAKTMSNVLGMDQVTPYRRYLVRAGAWDWSHMRHFLEEECFSVYSGDTCDEDGYELADSSNDDEAETGNDSDNSDGESGSGFEEL